jgi:4-amino-4-deoxy-L-arabinose transferase-like glycosyltransferase
MSAATYTPSAVYHRASCRLKPLPLAILFLIWAATQFAGIFWPPLMDDADAVHVEAVREMVMRHNYVTLYADGVRYFDKPPLPYWLGAFSAQIFGMHDWAIRLPLALSVLVLTIYLYQFGCRIYSERAGFYAALAFATSIGPYLFTRFYIPDIILALWTIISVDLTLRMVHSIQHHGRAKYWQAIAFGLVAAAATLTKGLIGVVFPAGILICYLAATGRLRWFTKMRPFIGTLVFLAVGAPWHILAAIRNPPGGESKGWFWFYFINDQYYRYLNKRIPHDYDKIPLFLFVILLVVWLLPWGSFLFAALARWWRDRSERLRSPDFIMIVCVLFILLFFSFSTRQEYYSLPAVPALTLLIGDFLAREQAGEPRTRRGARWSAASLFAVGLIIAIACTYLAVIAHRPPPGTTLFDSMQSHPKDYAASMGHFLDLTAESYSFFRWPLLATAAGMLIGTGAAFFLRLGRNLPARRIHAANLALAAGMTAVLMAAHAGLATFYPTIGSYALAAPINAQWTPTSRIVFDADYSKFASLNFYTRQPIYMLNHRINTLWYGSYFPDAPHRFEGNEEFAAQWRGPDQVFFVTMHPEHLAALAPGTNAYLVTQSAGKYVLSNQQSATRPTWPVRLQ